MSKNPWNGSGLGLRRELVKPLIEAIPSAIDFMEIAPENWIGVGGRNGRALRQLAEQVPIVAHGLCLNLGGDLPLDRKLISNIGTMMRELNMPFYSEHLSCCADDGILYDLMPIPFTSEAVRHVANRIRQVQDMLGQRIGLENISYYAESPINEMSESAFFRAVVEEADCLIHLDVNNCFVNSVNHGTDPHDYISSLPSERIAYIHIAGHLRESETLAVDTHGMPVIDPVWSLLDYTYYCHGHCPTLLERDFNLPPLAQLVSEVEIIAKAQARSAERINHAKAA